MLAFPIQKFLCDVVSLLTIDITLDISITTRTIIISYFFIIFGSEKPVSNLHLYKFIELKGIWFVHLNPIREEVR